MSPMEFPNNDHPVLIFDGVCNLCEWLVIFVVKRDRRGRFKFVAAQSELGRLLQQQSEVDAIGNTTMILLKNGKVFTKSDAAIEIAKDLDGLWRLLAAFGVIPKALRDLIYGWIGNNRYKWFGYKNQCMLPAEELKRRFLSQ